MSSCRILLVIYCRSSFVRSSHQSCSIIKSDFIKKEFFLKRNLRGKSSNSELFLVPIFLHLDRTRRFTLKIYDQFEFGKYRQGKIRIRALFRKKWLIVWLYKINLLKALHVDHGVDNLTSNLS